MPPAVFLLSPSEILAALPLEGNPGKQSGAPPAVFLLSPLGRVASVCEPREDERGREKKKKDKFKIFVNQSDITEDVKKSV